MTKAKGLLKIVGNIMTIRFAEEIWNEISRFTKTKIEEKRQERRIKKFRKELDANLNHLLFKDDVKKKGFEKVYYGIKSLPEIERH